MAAMVGRRLAFILALSIIIFIFTDTNLFFSPAPVLRSTRVEPEREVVSNEPTGQPTPQPTGRPTPQPTGRPTSQPAPQPTAFVFDPDATYHIPLDKQNEHPACAHCAKPEGFFELPLDKITFLSSFPGSGNTWIISLLSLGSRTEHCSVYEYNGIYGSNFDFDRCIVTKTHYPFYTTDYDLQHFFNSPALHLLRSPFDSILAELFRRNYTRDMVAQDFAFFANKWRVSMAHHFEPMFWNSTSLAWKRQDVGGTIQFASTNSSRAQQVLFYEDFISHQTQSMINAFTFLQQVQGTAHVPSVPDDVTCAMEMDKYALRKGTLRGRKKEDFFALPEHANLTKRACELWQEYWFEEMWGPCMDAEGRHFSKNVSPGTSLKQFPPPLCFEKME